MNSIATPEASDAVPVARTWSDRVEQLRHLPVWLRCAVITGAVAGIGFLDHMAGRGASFFVFYALPIILMTWFVSLRGGLWLAAASGVIWLLANDLSQLHPSPLQLGWITFGRITYFVLIAIGTSALRTKHEADAAQIELLREMRQLEMDIVNARESEQQRIGQDLHDGLCQQLAALGCAAQALADDLQSHNVPEAEDARKIGEALQQTVVEARSLAGGMSSLHVDRGGLCAALATLAQSTNRLSSVPVRLHAPPTVNIESPETATHLYRIAQEAVGNALRHSGASEVTIRLDARANHLELRIEDDGCGIPSQQKHRVTGIGLQTMRYRAHAIGADLIIHPRSGGGTVVRCQLEFKPQSLHTHHAAS